MAIPLLIPLIANTLPLVADQQVVPQYAGTGDIEVPLAAAVEPRLIARFKVKLGAATDPSRVFLVAEIAVAEEGEGLGGPFDEGIHLTVQDSIL